MLATFRRLQNNTRIISPIVSFSSTLKRQEVIPSDFFPLTQDDIKKLSKIHINALEDLAKQPLSAVRNSLEKVNLNVTTEALEKVKIKSNIYASTKMPIILIDILMGIKKMEGISPINTLLDLTEISKTEVVDKLIKNLTDAELTQIKQGFSNDFFSKIKPLFQHYAIQQVLPTSTVNHLYTFNQLSKDINRTKNTEEKEKLEKTRIKQAISIHIDLGKIAGKLKWIKEIQKKDFCNCAWEESVFSEKAYLVYLSKIANYDEALIQQKFRLNLNDSRLIENEPGYPVRTVIQEAILKLQEELRKQYDHQLMNKNFSSVEKPFLDYEEWLSYMFTRAFPENSFEMIWEKEPFTGINTPFTLFNANPDTLENRNINVKQFSEKLVFAVTNTLVWPEIWRAIYEIRDGTVQENGTQWKWEALVVAKPEHQNQDVLKSSEIDRDPYTRDLQVQLKDNPAVTKYLRGTSNNPGILIEMAQSMQELLLAYNDILIAAINGFKKNEWTIPKSLDDNTEVLQRFKRISSETLNDIFSTQSGITLKLGNASIGEIFENVRLRGNDAYQLYKNDLNQIRSSDFSTSHTENVRRIVQSTLLLKDNSSQFFDEGFYRDNMFNTVYMLFSRLDRSISNVFHSTEEEIEPGLFKRKAILEESDKSEKVHFDQNGFVFKDRNTTLPAYSLYQFLNQYTQYYASLNISREGDEELPTHGKASHLLTTPTLITQRLKLELRYMDGKKIKWENLAQLYFNLLYHLPYVQYFILPILHAKYEQSQNNFSAAETWLSLIVDHYGPNSSFILPFSLIPAEENYVRLLLGEILLDHAEILYRENTYESIQHAKELYEKVVKLFKDYSCFVNFEENKNIAKQVAAIIRDNALSPHVRKKFIRTITNTDLNKLSNFEEFRAISSKSENKELKINEFANRINQVNIAHLNFSEQLNFLKTYQQRSNTIEIEQVFSDLGPSGPQPIQNPTIDIEDFLENLNPRLKQGIGVPDLNKLRPIQDFPGIGFPDRPISIALQVRFNLCAYPNPRIINMLKTANQYLGYINQCRNFLGYRQDDISIYSYEELLNKSRHYIQLALNLEEKYLQYLERFQNEQEKQMLLVQSVLRDQAQVALGNLQTQETKKLVEISSIQLESAQAAKRAYDSMAPLRRFSQAISLIAQVGKTVASAVATQGASLVKDGPDTMVAFSNYALNEAEMQNQSEQLQYGIDIAQKNIEVSAIRQQMAQLQQSMAETQLILDKILLQYFFNKTLGKEAYFYMYNKAKQLYKSYVDMAIRLAWLAERQIEFLRATEINTIRFNYYHSKNQSKADGLLLAAETLQKDIEELNYQRELSEKNPIKVKKTFSLRKEEPILFASDFLTTGVIRFHTTADYCIFQRESITDSQNSLKLAYQGHRNLPDYFGHLQQRIESIELKLIGLVAQDQDIKISLSNGGYSLVLKENPRADISQVDNNSILPVILRRPFQTIVFSRALGQDTQSVYHFTAEKLGIFKPFETIGLDTAWELRLDPSTNPIDMKNIHDIQLIINYSAEYSSLYEELQRKNLPEPQRSRIFSMRSDFPEAFYAFQQPPRFPGTRDIRFLRFETNENQLGPNEKEQEITNIQLYIRPKNVSTATEGSVLKAKLGVFNTRNTNSFFKQVPTQFTPHINNPPRNNSQNLNEPTKLPGYLDYSNDIPGETNSARRNIKELFFKPTVNKVWSLKVIPEENTQYYKKDATGTALNVTGQPISEGVSLRKDVLHVNNTSGEIQTYKIKLSPNIQSSWDNYHTHIKFKLVNKDIVFSYLENERGSTFYIHFSLNTGLLGIYGKLDENPLTELQFPFTSNEWYVFDCRFITKNNNEIWIELTIDGLVIFSDSLSISNNGVGSLSIVANDQSEAYFDDLIIHQVDRQGRNIRSLFKDEFDEIRERDWEDVNRGDCFKRKEDENPALDLEFVEDVIFVTDYTFKT